MRVKSEKIAEIYTFFFETRPKWQPYIAKQSFFLQQVSRVRRQSLAHAYAHAFQQRCCFFAVTSVTLRVRTEGKWVDIELKLAAKYTFFDGLAVVFLRNTRLDLLKFIS